MTSRNPGDPADSPRRSDYPEAGQGKDTKDKSSSVFLRPWLLFTPRSDRKMRSNHNMLITMIPVFAVIFAVIFAIIGLMRKVRGRRRNK